MELTHFLHNIIVLFGGALVVIAVCQRIRVPAIAGFLITGMIVGPHGLALIKDAGTVETFADLGVVFLLFLIGLELSTTRLKRVARFFALGGGLQSLITLLAAVGLGYCAALPFKQSFYWGFVLVQSSTAIVMKLYSDRQELSSPQGEISTGILLFQDLTIVPLLVLIPLLAGATQGSTGGVAIKFGLSLLAIVAVFFAARYTLPLLLKLVVKTQIRELLVISALFICMGAASITQLFGFSFALGAFLAGVLIAESDYTNQFTAESAPFRDVFNSLFFMSIGMLLRLDFAVQHLVLIITVGLSVIVFKAIILFTSVRTLRFPWRTALLAALGMSQIGEFAFVLIRSGSSYGLIDPYYYQLAIATAVFTMLLTPFLMGLAPSLSLGKGEFAGTDAPSPAPQSGGSTKGAQVIIVGFGLAGRHLARVLKEAYIPYVIIEIDGHLVQQAKNAGEPIVYGDATRREILERCKIATAQAVVFVISEPLALQRSIRLARHLNPQVLIIARTRRFSDLESLLKEGADEVVAEEFEASIEIFTHLLTRLHVPRNLVRAQTKVLRDSGYQMLRVPAPSKGISDRLAQVLASGTTDTFYVAPEHYAKGRSLGNLRLRHFSGATAIAIVRNEKSMTNPPSEMQLETGDVLVLVGSHAQIDNAFSYLETGAQAGGHVDPALTGYFNSSIFNVFRYEFPITALQR